tara:strand:- start:410 stop:1201 length:792 start_codon:yes stop_codon:yes gene_type:complete
MKKLPLVSVVINCHNGEKFLRECINSIIKQKYKNWEIIFWDNLSTDKSQQIINSFKDKRIRVYKSKVFTSLYKARNLAIKKTKGRYICFLDTDDKMFSDKILKQVRFLEKNLSFKMVYSNYFILKQKMKNLSLRHNKKFNSGKITQELINDYSVGILTVLIHRKVFKNLKFNDKFNIIGDFDFFVKTSLKHKIAYMNEPTAIYRLHNENYTNKNLDKFINELNFWLKTNSEYFSKKNISLLSQKYYLIKLKIKYFLKKVFKKN